MRAVILKKKNIIFNNHLWNKYIADLVSIIFYLQMFALHQLEHTLELVTYLALEDEHFLAYDGGGIDAGATQVWGHCRVWMFGLCHCRRPQSCCWGRC